MGELDKLREELKQIELDDEKIRDSFLSIMDKTCKAILKDVDAVPHIRKDGYPVSLDEYEKEIKQLLTVPQETPEVSIVYNEPEGDDSHHQTPSDTSTKCECLDDMFFSKATMGYSNKGDTWTILKQDWNKIVKKFKKAVNSP